MKRWLTLAAIAAALIVGFAAPAAAQNPICATMPLGDSSNACASDAFVQNAVTPAAGLAVNAAQMLTPTTCSVRDARTVPFPVIIDGGTPIGLSTNSLCPEFPFNGTLAQPTADNITFFNNQPVGFAGYSLIWANRCNIGGAPGALCDATNSGNFPIFTFSAVQYRFFFTTVARADACTIAQTQGYFGNTTGAQATLAAAGVVQLNVSNPLPQQTGGIFQDVCWLAYVQMPAMVQSVILDWEVADNRTTTQSLATLTTLASLVHAANFKAIFYSNNVGLFSASPPGWATSTACLSSGICAAGPTTIAPNILALFDFSTIIADTSAANLSPYGIGQYLQGQANAYGATTSAAFAKILLEAQIGGYTIAQTAAVATFIRNNSVGAVDLFNNAAAWGAYSDSAYQQTRCLVYANPAQCGQFPFATIPNDGVTGTTINLLAKLTSSGNAVVTATTDTDGAVGVVMGNAGTTDSAQIVTNGQAACVFDNTSTPAHFVTISGTVAGNCHDAGATRPTGVQVLGKVLSGGAAGLATIQVQIDGPGITSSTILSNTTSGSGICVPGPVSYGGTMQIGCATDNMTITSLTLSGNELLASASVIKWNSDVGLSRLGANFLGVGNGTQGDASAQFRVGALGVGINPFATGLGVSGAYVNPGGNGIAMIGGASTNGAQYGGQGTVNDSQFLNKTGQVVCANATGTQTLNCTALQAGGNNVVTSAASLTANQLVIGSGSQGEQTLGSLGTTTTVLHGNGSGAPSFAAVSLTADITGTLGVGNGGTGTATTFTQGSVVFAGASGIYAQDNAKFFWDASNHRLGLGLASPGFTLHIQGVDGVNAFVINNTATQNVFQMRSSATGAGIFDLTDNSGAAQVELRGDSSLSFLGGAGPVGIGVTSGVTGSAGELALKKITDPNTAPGATVLKLTVEAGTNAGSCKIVARAGTSNTAVTVVDNVGTGC